MLDFCYYALTAACIILQPQCYLAKHGMVVSPKAESVPTTAHEIVKWLRLIVSLLRQLVS